MADSFDPLEYLTHLRRNGRFAALAIGTAVVLTVVVCLLLPKQYTATATLVIEPPVANDPRAATSVSPVYLESLRTYEQFAGSDSLFAKACTKFGLSEDGACNESFKRRVLRVTKLKDTKVLQIGVSLPEAKQAQQLVEYLATETVAMNRALALEGDRTVMDDVQKQLDAAAEQLRKARGEFEAAVARGVEQILDEDVRTLGELKARTGVELLRSRAALAELNSRKDSSEAAVEQARLNSLVAEAASLDKQMASKSTALATARARRDRAGETLRIAEEKHEAWSRRANDAAISTGMRTEQLRVVDPGVVPQQPSFPNTPLFVAAAFLLSSLLALGYLSLRYGLDRTRAQQQARTEWDELKAGRGGHR